MLRVLFRSLIVVLFGSTVAAAGEIDFNRDIRPILSDNCFLCHGPDANHRQADLRLDERSDAVDYGAIVPGDPDSSSAVERILSEDDDVRMPPPSSNKSLTAAQKELLVRWIAEGADYAEHWSLLSPRRPLPPPVDDPTWPANPIDHFILERLEREQLAPSLPAEPATLLRRVSLDLTGLPPTPEELEAFLADPSAEAYESAVERLLASPAYGERMAWDWMEASRYADSNGYQGDGERTMWPWRDWVVKAFNQNLPYDEFTVWQLAGDRLPDATTEQQLATAFCRNHPINGEGGRIPEENRVDYVMDMTETMGTVWLGLTLNCTRCHDHKFDPITRADYFGLYAFFNQTPVTGAGRDPQTAPVLAMAEPEVQARLAKLEESVTKAGRNVTRLEAAVFARPEGKAASTAERAEGLPEEIKTLLNTVAGRRSIKDLRTLRKELAELEPELAESLAALEQATTARDKLSASVPRVMVMADQDEPRPTYILEKGFYNQPGDEVSAGTPARLPPFPEGAPRDRLGLARWLVAPDHPLTARVTVNRFWQMFFGAGLVRTPEDFGVQGEYPTHPELLDWLAVEFVESGWDMKHLVRLIVTSATYRQSSRMTPELLERDPENRLLGRAPRFRMPSWMIRDQALAASGLLAVQTEGPPVQPYQPPGVWEEATFGKKTYETDSGAALYRRSLYTFWRRIIGPTMFFDSASRSVCSVEPTRTNTPLHALATLNDTTYVEAARALAQRVLQSRAPDDARLDLAFRLVLGRSPRDEERRVLQAGRLRTLEQLRAEPERALELLSVGESPRDERLDAQEHAAWTVTCLSILNLDEALTKE